MITTNQIHYIAGIWEGEGCFTKNNGTHKISITMTDEDIINKVRNFMGVNCTIYHYSSKGKKDTYGFQLLGSRAIQWMMTLYSLMGERRKMQIRTLLNEWIIRKRSSDTLCRHGHPFTVINRDFKYEMNGTKCCLHCRKIKSRYGTLKAGLEAINATS